MYKKLELTEKHKSFIKLVCDLEQESLIRCHSHDQSQVDAMAEQMNAEMITIKEYQQELSNAFYEFQVVMEEPEKILQMDAHYIGIFKIMMEIYHERLINSYPDIYWEFLATIETLTTLKENINLN